MLIDLWQLNLLVRSHYLKPQCDSLTNYGLPELDLPTAIIHHLTTVGLHEHTLGTFTADFIVSVQGPMSPDGRYDAITAVSCGAEATMRNGKEDTTLYRQKFIGVGST